MGKQSLDNLGVSAFCESMAMMLHSSIQVDEAIGLLQQMADRMAENIALCWQWLRARQEALAEIKRLPKLAKYIRTMLLKKKGEED